MGLLDPIQVSQVKEIVKDSGKGGSVEFATEEEAIAGVDNTKAMTPLRTAQGIIAKIANIDLAKGENIKVTTQGDIEYTHLHDIPFRRERDWIPNEYIFLEGHNPAEDISACTYFVLKAKEPYIENYTDLSVKFRLKIEPEDGNVIDIDCVASTGIDNVYNKINIPILMTSRVSLWCNCLENPNGYLPNDVFEIGFYISTGSESSEIILFDAKTGLVTDKMAIHKFPDLTKDFHTFFEPSASGVYRCFGMMENIPNGYFAGDNDFYAFVYAVSEKYKTVEIMDIRSGRRFTKCMLAGKWNDWFEWGINQGGQVPTLVWANVFSAGSRVDYSLSTMEATKDDVLWVSCGNRGMAIKVDDLEYLEDYSASYYTDFDNDTIVCWAASEGATPMTHIEIYKFVTTPVTPPRGGCPYITLNDVVDDLSNTTNKGDVFVVDVKVKSIELHRNPKITLDFGTYNYTSDLLFDGRAKWSFQFPFQPDGNWKQGNTITYTLSWQDQNAMLYNGFEKIQKNIIV